MKLTQIPVNDYSSQALFFIFLKVFHTIDNFKEIVYIIHNSSNILSFFFLFESISRAPPPGVTISKLFSQIHCC